MGKKIELRKEVAEKYEVINKPVSNRFVDPVFGLIDFSEMTLKTATTLVRSGKFQYLAPKKGGK